MRSTKRLAVVTSHPIQYYAPLFRCLATRIDLEVFFAHRTTPEEQAEAGFGTPFQWDIDLLSDYAHTFLTNVSRAPTTARFWGCDTPEISDRLEVGRFDGVLVLGWYLKAFIQAIVAAKRRRIPVMVRGDSQLATPSGPAKRAIKRALYPMALRTFDALLYVGVRSREYYERFAVPEDRLFFSPHCVDTEWFAARASPEARRTIRAAHGIGADERVVLFAGKLLDRKRPLDLIRAAALLKREGLPITVMIAGSGPLEQAIMALARDAGVRVVLLGFCNQSAMPACYAGADLLVLPSTGEETWGLVANEALACGRPIVVSHVVGCAPDLAGDQSAGRTFTLGDWHGLAMTIGSLLADPPSPPAIRAKSEAYSLEAASQGVLRAFEHVRGLRPQSIKPSDY